MAGIDNSVLSAKLKVKAIARISELGVQKYTFGVNWVSKISNRVSKLHPDTLLAKIKGLLKVTLLSMCGYKLNVYHSTFS